MLLRDQLCLSLNAQITFHVDELKQRARAAGAGATVHHGAMIANGQFQLATSEGEPGALGALDQHLQIVRGE